jgi:hypothetical protein
MGKLQQETMISRVGNLHVEFPLHFPLWEIYTWNFSYISPHGKFTLKMWKFLLIFQWGNYNRKLWFPVWEIYTWNFPYISPKGKFTLRISLTFPLTKNLHLEFFLHFPTREIDTRNVKISTKFPMVETTTGNYDFSYGKFTRGISLTFPLMGNLHLEIPLRFP